MPVDSTKASGKVPRNGSSKSASLVPLPPLRLCSGPGIFHKRAPQVPKDLRALKALKALKALNPLPGSLEAQDEQALLLLQQPLASLVLPWSCAKANAKTRNNPEPLEPRCSCRRPGARRSGRCCLDLTSPRIPSYTSQTADPSNTSRCGALKLSLFEKEAIDAICFRVTSQTNARHASSMWERRPEPRTAPWDPRPKLRPQSRRSRASCGLLRTSRRARIR